MHLRKSLREPFDTRDSEVANAQTLSYRRDTQTLIQMGSYDTMQMHPLEARLEEQILERLQRGSFVN